MRDLIRVTTLSWVIATATPALAVSPPMGEDEARLLLARTGFAATADDVRAFSGLTREQAQDHYPRVNPAACRRGDPLTGRFWPYSEGREGPLP
jgi:hypothetical protein